MFLLITPHLQLNALLLECRKVVILGPYLFNIYIIDAVNVDPNVKYTIYANDDCDRLFQRRNQVLLKLTEWASCNGLVINVAKTRVVVFQAKSKHFVQCSPLLLNGKSLITSKLLVLYLLNICHGTQILIVQLTRQFVHQDFSTVTVTYHQQRLGFWFITLYLCLPLNTVFSCEELPLPKTFLNSKDLKTI